MLPKYNPERALYQTVQGLSAECVGVGTKVWTVGLYGRHRLSVQGQGRRAAMTGDEFDTLQVSSIKWYTQGDSNPPS